MFSRSFKIIEEQMGKPIKVSTGGENAGLWVFTSRAALRTAHSSIRMVANSLRVAARRGAHVDDRSPPVHNPQCHNRSPLFARLTLTTDPQVIADDMDNVANLNLSRAVEFPPSKVFRTREPPPATNVAALEKRRLLVVDCSRVILTRATRIPSPRRTGEIHRIPESGARVGYSRWFCGGILMMLGRVLSPTD